MRVFDFDNTLYDGESPLDFYLFSIRYNPRVLLLIPPVLWHTVRYKRSKSTLEGLTRAISRYIRFYLNSFSDVDALVKKFWDTHMHKIRSWYKPEPGDVIITASFNCTMDELLRRWHGVDSICSQVDTTTNTLKYLNFGENKVKVFRERFGEDCRPDEFYSDNMVDLPMMRLATHAYLVKGNTIKEVDTSKM